MPARLRYNSSAAARKYNDENNSYDGGRARALYDTNVFNLVLVSGVSVTLAPFTIPQSSTLFGVNSSLVLDLPVMLAVMLIMTVPALVKGKMNRAQGIILLAIYAAFCAIQFTM